MKILITIEQKGMRLGTVEKLVEQIIKTKYPEARFRVELKETPSSRSERWAEIQSQVSDAKSEAESLRDELQEWRDNLPENLQSGTKADELDEAVSEIESAISSLEDFESSEPSFPGMY